MKGICLQELGRSIKRLQSRHHRSLDTALAPIGVTLPQWDALRAIARHPLASSHDLAELTFQSDQSFGALASRLVRKGLVTRSRGKGRALAHSLTPEGERLLLEGTALAKTVLAESFCPLSEAERAQLLALIGRMLSSEDASR